MRLNPKLCMLAAGFLALGACSQEAPAPTDDGAADTAAAPDATAEGDAADETRTGTGDTRTGTG